MMKRTLIAVAMAFFGVGVAAAQQLDGLVERERHQRRRRLELGVGRRRRRDQGGVAQGRRGAREHERHGGEDDEGAAHQAMLAIPGPRCKPARRCYRAPVPGAPAPADRAV